MTDLSSSQATVWSDENNLASCYSSDPTQHGYILPENSMVVGEPTRSVENCLCGGSMVYPGANNGVNDFLMEGGTRSYHGLVKKDEGFHYADRILTSFRRSNAHGMASSDREFIKSEAVNRRGQPAASAEESVGYLIGIFHQQYGKAPTMNQAVFVLPRSRAVATLLHQAAALMLCEGTPPEQIVQGIKDAANELGALTAPHELALNNSQ
jgi:hypothetical protein